MPKEEEELDDNGNVLHNDQTSIRVSWYGRDSESGIKSFKLAMGTENMPEAIMQFRDVGSLTTENIRDIFLPTSAESNQLYIVSVKAINGAGLESETGISKSIFIQKANVPGVVFDGRKLFVDESFTTDYSSIAASFYGFESESCNIVSYNWAVGTTEYGTDVLSYTDYGLVMLNASHGQAQIHTELFEDVKYFITVRAITGCHDEYILSCSDGITLDMTAPEARFETEISNDTRTFVHEGVMYQSTIDSLKITANVTDKNSIMSTQWALGSLPLLDDRHEFTADLSSLTSVATLVPGEAVFLTANIRDKAGNTNLTSSFAVIADNTPPTITGLLCTTTLSLKKSLLTCSWEIISEQESLLEEIKATLGSNKTSNDVLDFLNIDAGSTMFVYDLFNDITARPNLTSVYVTIEIFNIVGLSTKYSRKVKIDKTPPTASRLNVITSTGDKTVLKHQLCQLPTGYIEVMVEDVADEESGINESRQE